MAHLYPQSQSCFAEVLNDAYLNLHPNPPAESCLKMFMLLILTFLLM
jgi:hypothetical protein